jgi:hypothetical protein
MRRCASSVISCFSLDESQIQRVASCRLHLLGDLLKLIVQSLGQGGEELRTSQWCVYVRMAQMAVPLPRACRAHGWGCQCRRTTRAAGR